MGTAMKYSICDNELNYIRIFLTLMTGLAHVCHCACPYDAVLSIH